MQAFSFAAHKVEDKYNIKSFHLVYIDRLMSSLWITGSDSTQREPCKAVYYFNLFHVLM